MKNPIIDLRSDTITRPTEEMRRAMAAAEVGDDVLREDPTLNRLEDEAAAILGKEASLFVPSGTFGNQLALFTHCQRGEEVVLADDSHIVQHEAGGAAVLAGVQLRTIPTAEGLLDWKRVQPYIRTGDDIHCPRTALVELENALSSGEVMEPGAMAEIHAQASLFGFRIHLDGARIFNAARYLKIEAKEITKYADSVMFCLSKGLCSPVGSLLCGDRDFIDRARRKRKIMGGGMRQAGVLAAAGLVSLNRMIGRLEEDHRKAALLAGAFQTTGLYEVKPWPLKINMFYVRFRGQTGCGPSGREAALTAALKARGVLTYPPWPDGGWIRFVTHNDVSMELVERAAPLVKEATEEALRSNPTIPPSHAGTP